MAAVDFERAWLRLKEHALSRPSHGKRDLLERMSELELECEMPEGQDWAPDAPADRTEPADRGRSLGATDAVMATH